MSSGKIQAKMLHEIRSVAFFMWVGHRKEGNIREKERHSIFYILSILVLRCTCILEGQRARYSGQTLDIQWCSSLIPSSHLCKNL